MGAGSLGQTFCACIAVSGQRVTLLATPATVARLLSEDHIRLRGALVLDVPVSPAPGGPGCVGITSDPSMLPEGAALLFATKAHQLRGAVQQLRSHLRAATPPLWIAGLQNGLLKDAVLSDAFAGQAVIGAATTVGAQRQPDASITVTGVGATYLGDLGGGISERVVAAAGTLRRAGLPVEVTANIQGVLWAKACNAAGVFGVSVLSRRASLAMMSDASLVRAYLSLLREAGAVADAYGVELLDYGNVSLRARLERPETEVVRELVERAANARAASPGADEFPSMTQDLLAGRALEVNEVIGDLVDRAELGGVSVPRLTLVRDLIRGVDPGSRATS